MRNLVLLPPQYIGTREWYTAMQNADVAVVDISTRHNKRYKSVHRATITGPGGDISLTVPVTHQSGQSTWSDVKISSHGEWWRVHRGAIESCYGRTPYFEHYYPLLRELLTEQSVGLPIPLFDAMLDSLIREILGIATPVSATIFPGDWHITDLRNKTFDGECILGDIFRHGRL